MVTLELFGKGEPWHWACMSGFGAFLQLLADVVGDEVPVGQGLRTREGVQVIVELDDPLSARGDRKVWKDRMHRLASVWKRSRIEGVHCRAVVTDHLVMGQVVRIGDRLSQISEVIMKTK